MASVINYSTDDRMAYKKDVPGHPASYNTDIHDIVDIAGYEDIWLSSWIKDIDYNREIASGMAI